MRRADLRQTLWGGSSQRSVSEVWSPGPGPRKCCHCFTRLRVYGSPDRVARGLPTGGHPVLPFLLLFLEFLVFFSLARTSFVFLSVFPFFSRDFGGSVGLCFSLARNSFVFSRDFGGSVGT